MSTSPDQADLLEFLTIIYGEQDGYVYSPVRPVGSQAWNQFFFRWPHEKQSLIRHILTKSVDNDVYYSPQLLSEPNARKEAFKTTQVLWAEFDGDLPEDISAVPSPTLKIQSSTPGHEHWYWVLNFPLFSEKIVETLTKKIAYCINADKCWNVNRVLRPIETIHQESKLRVKVVYRSSKKLSPEDFVNVPDIPDNIDNLDVGKIPNVLDVIAAYQIPQDLWKLFKAKEMEKGTRSSALMKLAHFCVEVGMSNEEVFSILNYKDSSHWKKYEGRPDQKDRLLSLIKSARTKTKKTALALPIFNFEDFFLNRSEGARWLIEGLFLETGNFLVTGPPEIGKTQLALQLAIHMVLGKSFLDWEIVKPQKLVFLSLEMNHDSLLIFLDSMKKDLTTEELEILAKNFHIIPLGEALRLAETEDQNKLTELLSQVRPTGVIIDSLGQAVVDDINSDVIINKVFNYVNSVIKNRFGAFCMFIHHPRKSQIGNKKPKNLDDLYGSRYIGAHADAVLCMWPTGKDIELSFLKVRLGKAIDSFAIQRTENLNFTKARIRAKTKRNTTNRGDADDDFLTF